MAEQHARSTHAQVIDAFGGPNRFRPGQLQLPAAGPTQVQLSVSAAGVNPVDLTSRAGHNIPESDARFPMVLGWDVAGTVIGLGQAVQGWQIGNRVAAMTFQPLDQNGTYTEYLNLDAGLLASVPDELPLEQAATLPLAGLTASQLLNASSLAAGSTLLVNGPLGAVGRLLLQLASRQGITVIAVTTHVERDAALRLGATEIVDRGDFNAEVRQLHPNGVDAAVDLVGGRAARSALDAVRDGGVYVTAVPPYIDPTGPFDPERGIPVQSFVVHPDPVTLTNLLNMFARGELSSPIEHRYQLTDAGAAHRRQEQGKLRGKIILLP